MFVFTVLGFGDIQYVKSLSTVQLLNFSRKRPHIQDVSMEDCLAWAMENQYMGYFTTQILWQNARHGSIQNFTVISVFAADGSNNLSAAAKYVTSKRKRLDGQSYFVYRYIVYNDEFFSKK